MSKKKILKTTTNNRVYNITRYWMIVKEECLCFLCPRHGGENPPSSKGRIRNWKRFRKTQYK